ncbi:MAG: hypothetical protein K5924_12100 [Chloroflexi bacterium]|nr:hypothetical protein [Chloroflexota bacterium]
MFDYRLFFPSSTLDGAEAPRRPHVGHHAKRVVRQAAERRDQRRERR